MNRKFGLSQHRCQTNQPSRVTKFTLIVLLTWEDWIDFSGRWQAGKARDSGIATIFFRAQRIQFVRQHAVLGPQKTFMDKVRFSCPRCSTVMQTGADRVGASVACPQCRHEFKLVDHPSSGGDSAPQVDVDAPTMAPGHAAASGASSSSPISQPKPSPLPPGYGQSAGSSTGGSSWSPSPSSSPAYMGGASQPSGFRCPYCGTNQPPVWRSEVSQLGWVVFAILLVTTCVFCFVGLFMRNRYRVCSQCRVRLE